MIKTLSMDTESKTAILYITNNGLTLAQRLTGLYPDVRVLRFKSEAVPELWDDCRNLIFIMAAGIVVRTIASLIKNKKTDPAVVVLDEKGRFVISLLSSHLGGANRIAREIADFLGSEAVITTASDINNMPSIDLWAKENNLIIDNWDLAPKISTTFINTGILRVYPEIDINLPEEFLKVEPRSADVLITNKIDIYNRPSGKEIKYPARRYGMKDRLYLRPQNLVIGIGCNSGTSEGEIEEAVRKVLEENNLSFLSINSLATIVKKGNEPGLVTFAEKYNFEIKKFTPDELNRVEGIARSESAFQATGAIAVSEPAALLASGNNRLLIPKQRMGNVTVAVAERAEEGLLPPFEIPMKKKGKIYIVGIGPGGIEHITSYAQNAIRRSNVILGYEKYLDLTKELFKDKEVISTGMTQEVERCKKAVDLALAGKTVSVISGGDPGIYAMAGLVFELIRARDTEYRIQTSDKKNLFYDSCVLSSKVHIEVIPGISAFNACAAKLGAPLMHDFACISLSDRLTPWEVIEKRLDTSADADFVIVLYNPKSKGRTKHIERARELILKYRNPETPVGIARGATREDEKIVITDLKNMLDYEIDMQTTVIVGNSQTFVWEGWMITPRGYKNRYEY
jgi:cobalt-precorrin 5A hydrolase/precorrin-3B C17-methyltransferase